MTLSVTMRVTFVVLSEMSQQCATVFGTEIQYMFLFWMKWNDLFNPLFIQCPQEANNTSKTKEIHISLK